MPRSLVKLTERGASWGVARPDSTVQYHKDLCFVFLLVVA